MIYMLFDNPADKNNVAFLEDYKAVSVNYVYPDKKCNTFKDMLNLSNKTVKHSAKGDTIICWYDFMAVICWWLCKIQFKKRRIIALNILLKNKNSLKNRVAKALYKPVLKSNNVSATVTSVNYGKNLNKILKIQKEYTLLHDLYYNEYNINYKGKVTPNTVFCGGRNGRDWDLLIKIANSMPNVTFNCVMPKDKFEYYKENFSCNMVVKYDISEAEFPELMCSSQLVVIPLDTEAPAGLIVFYQAAANGKMSITSNTVTTQEYFTNNQGVLCSGDIKDWKDKIYYYLNHSDKADSCAKNFRIFLENECSKEKYAKILWEMLLK